MNILNLTFNITGLATPPREFEIVTVHLISIWSIIFYFVVYLSIHIFLGIIKQNEEKIISNDKEHLERLKFLKLAFKWWPVVYLVFILVSYI